MTRVETNFDLITTPIPETLLGQLTADGAIVARPEQDTMAGLASYRLIDTDRAGLNALIDRLRTAGVEIDEVKPVRSSLEERFIEMVESNT